MRRAKIMGISKQTSTKKGLIMTVKKFIFRTYPDFFKRTIIVIVSIVLCIVFSYFVPGWEYLNTHLHFLENHFGEYIPQSILLSFYIFLFFILYEGLLNRFGKDFYISATNNDQFIVCDENQNEILIEKKDFQFTGEKTFSIKKNMSSIILRKHPKGISITSFKQYIDKIKEPQDLLIYFSGRILSMAIVYISLVASVVTYMAYAIVLYKILLPHMEALQILFRAKGLLLMIIIFLPFMSVFFLILYYFSQWTFLREQTITIAWSENGMMASIGKHKYEFKKDEIKISVFFINRLTHLTNRLIIEQKEGKRYMILGKSEDATNYQIFIGLYVKYFNIDIENSKTIIGSPKSILVQKKYIHN